MFGKLQPGRPGAGSRTLFGLGRGPGLLIIMAAQPPARISRTFGSANRIRCRRARSIVVMIEISSRTGLKPGSFFALRPSLIGQLFAATIRSISTKGILPTRRSTHFPLLNISKAGTLCTLNLSAKSPFFSMSTLRIVKAGRWPARSASTGFRERHGPHHSAQKSTRTRPPWSISALQAAASTSRRLPISSPFDLLLGAEPAYVFSTP